MSEHDLTAKRIGKYELLTRLATGGMAEVFLARERGIAGLERLVVIKRILPHLAEQQAFVEMFLREGRIIARLNHPNIVQIYELGSDASRYFLALEYIHGVTLRELQILLNRQNRPFPIEAAIAVSRQACKGLHAAHELKDLDGQPLGLVHRDVTPHNLMCTSDGLIKLLDFGIAKATEGVLEATFSGDLKGKFSYMSPEQVLQRPLDRRSDIFSLGILLWETLTGRRLFKRNSQLEMMQAITSGDVPPPSQFREDFPEELDAIVMRALQHDRNKRFEDANTLEHALEAFAKAQGMSADARALTALVDEVASDRLKQRDEALDEARQFHELSEDARTSLLHSTNSASIVNDEEELPTVVERPSEMPSLESTNSENISRTQPDQHLERTPTQEPTEPSSVRPLPDPSESNITSTTDSPEQETRKRGGVKRPHRLALLFAAFVCGAVVVIAIIVNSKGATRTGPPTELGWAPTVAPDVLKAEAQPLHDYLGDALSRDVDLVLTESYGELADALIEGKVDYAVLPPLLYVRTRERNSGITPLALKEFDGANKSDGLLLVAMQLDVEVLSDLKGKRFCLTDRNSTTGNFLPRAYLRRHGYEPDDFIGEVVWSGDHLQVMRDLIAGKCDVGATYSGAFISADKLGIPVGQVRTFAITGHVPQDVVCAGPHVPEQEREAMLEALLAFDPERDLGIERLGETQRITGFVRVKDSEWQDLRDAIAKDVERSK
ncbi:MAG: serine/threonine-protein kinase [Myxococcota bacterium]|nr:serine/threonine-protein kinase [Myxococcota bacterium]MEC9441805.1 serine/threonine-protein kinase [Myxococcota bacterium]